MRMWEVLFGVFPREFGTNRLFIRNKISFRGLVNKYNGIQNCYSSIYTIPNFRDYKNVTIDKLYLDFDRDDGWETVKRVHFELDYSHSILMTGNGFAIYIWTTKYIGDNAKAVLTNAQNYIAKEYNLSIGRPKEANLDTAVIGDIARIARIPNTMNIKPNKPVRYCIPIIEEDFDKSFKEIQTLAFKPRKIISYFEGNEGEPLFLKRFDRAIQQINKIITKLDFELAREIKDKEFGDFIGLLPPLIGTLLKTKRDGFHDRYLTILAMRDKGLPKVIAMKICQKYWSAEKFQHCLREISGGQFEYLYNRHDLLFPNWDTIEQMGYLVTSKDREFVFYRGDRDD